MCTSAYQPGCSTVAVSLAGEHWRQGEADRGGRAPLCAPHVRRRYQGLAGRETAAGDTIGRSAHGAQPRRLAGVPEEEVQDFLRALRSRRRCSLSPKGMPSERATPTDPLPNVTSCTTVKTISSGLLFYGHLALPSRICVQPQRGLVGGKSPQHRQLTWCTFVFAQSRLSTRRSALSAPASQDEQPPRAEHSH